MVGAKGSRGPPGPPGNCGCSSLSTSPFDDYANTGSYPKVPVVRKTLCCNQNNILGIIHKNVSQMF